MQEERDRGRWKEGEETAERKKVERQKERRREGRHIQSECFIPAWIESPVDGFCFEFLFV